MRRRVIAIMLLCIWIWGATPARAFWFWESATPEPTPSATDADASVGTPVEYTPSPQPSQTPSATPEPLPVVTTDESDVVRVKLASLGETTALGLTLEGSYAISNDPGFRFDRGTELAVALSGDSLYMAVGGLTINMGASIAFTRHAVEDGLTNGIVIHETGRENLYCGDLTLANDNGSITAILAIDLETYLYGVLPYEMSDSFPLEALKAQAVAARTYVMSRKNAARAYDVVDTPDSQVFRGYDADCERSIQAVDETRGIVARYQDDYAACYFSASNGGQTALPDQIWGGAGDYGYLDVRDDPYDVENPSSVVKRYTLSADGAALDAGILSLVKSQLTEPLAAMGYSDETADIRVVGVVSAEPEKPRFGAGNRMYQSLRLGLTVEAKRVYPAYPTPNPQTTPSYQAETLSQPVYVSVPFYGLLKEKYGLKINTSDWEILSVVPTKNGTPVTQNDMPDAFVLESRRFGHGIGLSQRGAQQMAKAHAMDAMQILRFYYPGATFERREYVSTKLTRLEDIPKSIGYARPRPTPKPTPAPLPPVQAGESYAVVALESKSSTLNVREQPSTTATAVAQLGYAQRLILIGEPTDGWAHIRTAEVEGYVSAEYIKKE